MPSNDVQTARPPKMRPYSPAWERAADALARTFAPDILPCRACRQPVVTGYACTWCGNENPRQAQER